MEPQGATLWRTVALVAAAVLICIAAALWRTRPNQGFEQLAGLKLPTAQPQPPQAPQPKPARARIEHDPPAPAKPAAPSPDRSAERPLPREACPYMGSACEQGSCDDGCRSCACDHGSWRCTGGTCADAPSCPAEPPETDTVACAREGQLCAEWGDCGPTCRCNGSTYHCTWPTCACPEVAQLQHGQTCTHPGLACRYTGGPCCRCVTTSQDTLWVCHEDLCGMDI